MKLKFYIVIIAGLTFSCHKDEDLAKTKLFTLKVDPSYNTSTTDNWVIIHDESGESLAFKTFESGDQVVLETTKNIQGSTIGITLVSYLGPGDKQNYSVSTRLNYPIRSEMILSTQSDTNSVTGNIIGSFNIKLTNPGGFDSWVLSDKFSRVGDSSSPTTESTVNLIGYALDTSPNYILTASDNQGNLKYKKLDNIKANDSYAVDFNGMTNFDKVIEFTFPESYSLLLFVNGREASQTPDQGGYETQSHYPNHLHTSIKVGYLNSLTNYSTYFSAGPYLYFNNGDIPDPNFKFPLKSDFNILSTDIKNFSSTSKMTFVNRVSVYSYTDPTNSINRVNWGIYSSSTNHVLKELPSEILSIHPMLAMNTLTYSNTYFEFGTLPYPSFTPINSNVKFLTYSINLN